jgi:hypothetical protein
MEALVLECVEVTFGEKTLDVNATSQTSQRGGRRSLTAKETA